MRFTTTVLAAAMAALTTARTEVAIGPFVDQTYSAALKKCVEDYIANRGSSCHALLHVRLKSLQRTSTQEGGSVAITTSRPGLTDGALRTIVWEPNVERASLAPRTRVLSGLSVPIMRALPNVGWAGVLPISTCVVGTTTTPAVTRRMIMLAVVAKP